MMDWFLGGSKTEDGDASDKLIKQGDAEREAGDLTAALHYYGNAVAVAGSPKKRKSALLAQARTYVLNGDLAEAEEAATRALDLGVCAPSLVRRGCARRKLGHFGAAYEDLRRAAQLDPQNREARDEIRRLHAAAQRRQKFEAEAQRDAEAEQLRASLPADVVDAVLAACREPFYAEASVAPGLGYELNAAIARLRGSVLAITPPRRCPGVNLSTTGKAVRDGKAPFNVDVVVRGDRPYEAGVWFRLVYASRAGPPRIRQASLGRTIVVDDDADHHGRRAGLQFYAFLASRSDEPFGLEAVVEGLRAALEDDGSDRWRHAAADHARRRKVIDAYRNEWPAHKIGLFEIDEPSALAAAVSAPGPFCAQLLPRSALAPRLVEAIEANDLRRCVEEVCEGVYAFDLFSAEFTAALLAEVDYFYGSKLPAARPNSMNNYGIIVNDIGLEPLIVALQRLVLLPLARALFSASDRGDPATGFDSTHAFVVKYRADEDSHLDVHTDDSDGR